MNSTFAYLDYFYPVLIGMMIYGDSLKARANEIMNQGSKPAGEADKIEEPEVETRKYRGVTLR